MIDHHRWMAAALRFGRSHLGRTSPNPSVACLIVKDDVVVGRGVTAVGGRPHAEVLALAEAGHRAKDARAYVTLEPCAHHGETPPCSAVLHKAGIVEVIVPMRDPDPRVCGKGIEELQKHGVNVIENICTEEARRDHAGHICHVTQGRPFVQMKMALTRDGYAGQADSRLVISDHQALQFGQRLRSCHDAIITGIGTVFVDDPQLTCRLPGLEHRSPQRYVLDRHLRLSLSSRLAQSELILVVLDAMDKEKLKPYQDAGIKILPFPENDFINRFLLNLSQQGLTRVLLEAGPTLSEVFLDHDLVDEVVLLQNSRLFEGQTGVKGFSERNWQCITASKDFKLYNDETMGNDTVKRYWRSKACLPA